MEQFPCTADSCAQTIIDTDPSTWECQNLKYTCASNATSCRGAPSKNLTSAAGRLDGILHHLSCRFHLFVEHQILPPPPRRMRAMTWTPVLSWDSLSVASSLLLYPSSSGGYPSARLGMPRQTHCRSREAIRSSGMISVISYLAEAPALGCSRIFLSMTRSPPTIRLS